MDVTRKIIFDQAKTVFQDFSPSLGNRCADTNERKAIIYCLRSWYVLSFDCQCDSFKRINAWVSLIYEIQDFNSLIATCKSLYATIVNSDIRFMTISDFKDQITGIPYGTPLLKPTWHLVERVYIHKDLESLRLLLCWLKHITKAKIPNKQLEHDSLIKWIKCEEQLANLVINECKLIDYMREFFNQVFIDPPSRLEGFHGNGAIAEPHIRGVGNKYLQDGRLPLVDIPDMIFSQKGFLQREFLTFTSKRDTAKRNSTSRLTFVSKTADSMRSICMEPAALMYAEEGLRVQIERLIKRNPLTRSAIHIDDRMVNQNAARMASLSNMYATVDLSSASDLVSYQLIDLVTRDINPEWRKALLRTRSTHVILPNGSIVELKKYAPMGSALCFPIETLVFTSVCYATERIFAEYHNQIEIHDYTVFGDDMIFNSSEVHLLYENLKYLGFQVNEDKSFVDGCFRESCGGDFYLGYNVTPQYNRVDLTKVNYSKHRPVFSGEFASGLQNLANNAYFAGYKYLRYYYILSLKDHYSRTRCTVAPGLTNNPDDSSRLYTPTFPLYGEKRRYNHKLMCSETLTMMPHVSYTTVPRDADRFLLSAWLRDRQYAKPDLWGILPIEYGCCDRSGEAHVSYTPTWSKDN